MQKPRGGQAEMFQVNGLNFLGSVQRRQGIQRLVEVYARLCKLACYNAFSAEPKARARRGFRGIALRSGVEWLLDDTRRLLTYLESQFK